MLGHYTTAPLFACLCVCFALTRVVRIISNFLAPVKPFQQLIFKIAYIVLQIWRSSISHSSLKPYPALSYLIVYPVNWLVSAPIAYNKKHIGTTFLLCFAWEVSVKRSISRPLVGLPSLPAALPTEGTITCIICQAVYAPSRLHAYLLQAPPIALESAFMSMCHFCFRCRRPSCPNCWDAVHAVCGQCTRETHVPFRIETPPLEGTSSLSAHSSLPIDDHSLSPSLVPVQPGRFQETPLPSTSTTSNHTSQTRFSVKSTGTSVAASPIDIDAIETRPERNGSPDLDAIETRPDRSKSRYTDKIKTRPDHFRSRKQKLMRTLLAFILLSVFLLLAAIAASLLLANVNISIYKLLHIDIRIELTSLWHFLRSLF